MNTRTRIQRRLALALPLLLAVATPAHAMGILDIPGFFSPQPHYKHGAVYTRAVVLQNGKPIWVTYGPTGEVAEEIGPAEGALDGARVMAAGAYRQLLAQLEALKSQYQLKESDVPSACTQACCPGLKGPFFRSWKRDWAF